jgi:hypothetical protein
MRVGQENSIPSCQKEKEIYTPDSQIHVLERRSYGQWIAGGAQNVNKPELIHVICAISSFDRRKEERGTTSRLKNASDTYAGQLYGTLLN